MKHSKLIIGLAALMAASVAAQAQEKAQPQTQGSEGYSVFGLGAGVQYWNLKDAKILDEDGLWGMNFIARIRPARLLGIDLRAGCSGVWDGDSYRLHGDRYSKDVTFSCVPLEAGLVLTIPVGDRCTVYGGPGIGYYHYDIDIEMSRKSGHHYTERTEHIRLEDDCGWYAVAGATFRLLPQLSLFGEVRYTDTETSLRHPEDYGATREETAIDCSGWGGQVGLMVEF